MIALPEGVKVYAGAQTWRGEAPAEFCPPDLLAAEPAAADKPAEKTE